MFRAADAHERRNAIWVKEFVMHFGIKTGALVLVTAAGLAMSGCATVEDVKHAQATADQALSTAQQAQSTANAAGQAAAAAQASADKANAGVDSLNARVNALEARHHKGERG
jgi:hypothetical protein